MPGIVLSQGNSLEQYSLRNYRPEIAGVRFSELSGQLDSLFAHHLQKRTSAQQQDSLRITHAALRKIQESVDEVPRSCAAAITWRTSTDDFAIETSDLFCRCGGNQRLIFSPTSPSLYFSVVAHRYHEHHAGFRHRRTARSGAKRRAGRSESSFHS